MNFGPLIKKHRLKKGLTQKELAYELGYSSPQFVHLIEIGKSKVPVTVLGELIVILRLPEKLIVEEFLFNAKNDFVRKLRSGKEYARDAYGLRN